MQPERLSHGIVQDRPLGKERTLDRKSEEAADLVDVAEVLRGNTSAFRGIVQRYKGLVFRLSLSYLNDPEEAEDACQEIFFKAFRSLRSFSLERRFLPWLYAVAGNHLRTRFGRARRRGGKITYAEMESFPAEKDSAPPELFQREESRRKIGTAVASHPSNVRDAVHLYYFEGMSVEQVSLALGIGRENVKSRLLRARKKLKVSLSEQATDEGSPGYTRVETGKGGLP
jgi:RNA polymerase sigma factor (sigma-70 family)